MPNQIGHGVTPREVFTALYQHRGKAAAAFLLVLLAGGAAAVFYPTRYASEAKLFVRLGRESVGLDPTATTGQTISISETRESEINSVIEMLRSRALLERVVDEITPQEILQTEYETPELTRDKAVQKLAKLVTIDAAKKSAVITIHAESRTPELAKKLCSIHLESYLSDHAKLNSTAGAYEFFLEQAADTSTKANEANQNLRDAKNRIGAASLELQRQEMQKQLATLQVQVLTAQAGIDAGVTKTADLARQVDKMPERVSDDQVTGLPNQGLDMMKQRLYELQLKEKELSTKFNSEHPQLVSIRDQVTEAKKLIQSEPLEKNTSTARINRLRENLDFALKTEQAALAALRTQLATFTAQRDQAQKALLKLNDDELVVHRLQREAELADARYKVCTEKLEQARMNQALNAERISNVNVVQRPTYVLKPVTPHPLLLLGVAAALAVFAAFATPMAAAYLDRTLRTTDEIEQQLNLPVLMSIPRFPVAETVGSQN